MKPSTITTTILGLAVVGLGITVINHNETLGYHNRRDRHNLEFIDRTNFELRRSWLQESNDFNRSISLIDKIIDTLVVLDHRHNDDKINLYDNQGMFNATLQELKARVAKIEEAKAREEAEKLRYNYPVDNMFPKLFTNMLWNIKSNNFNVYPLGIINTNK